MYDIRPLQPSDLDLVSAHRARVFKEAGFSKPSEIGSLPSFGKAATSGMMVIDWPPHPSHPAEARRRSHI